MFCVPKELNVGLASLLELPLQLLCNFMCLVRLDLYLDLKKQMLHSWYFAAVATSVKLSSDVAISNESSIPDKENNVTLITHVFHSLVPHSMVNYHFVSSIMGIDSGIYMPARSPKNLFFICRVFHRHGGYKSHTIYR